MHLKTYKVNGIKLVELQQTVSRTLKDEKVTDFQTFLSIYIINKISNVINFGLKAFRPGAVTPAFQCRLARLPWLDNLGCLEPKLIALGPLALVISQLNVVIT